MAKENLGYKSLISNIIRELALEKFPFGLPSIQALEKLDSAMSEVEAPPHLRLKVWKSLEQIGQRAESISYNRPLKIMLLKHITKLWDCF